MKEHSKIIIRLIKLLDIGILGIYYFIGGFILAFILNVLFPKFDEEKYNKKIYILIYEILLQIFVLMIGTFYLRHLIRAIPFPLDNKFGFSHKLVKELNGGVIIAFAVLYTQTNLKDKILYLSFKLK